MNPNAIALAATLIALGAPALAADPHALARDTVLAKRGTAATPESPAALQQQMDPHLRARLLIVPAALGPQQVSPSRTAPETAGSSPHERARRLLTQAFAARPAAAPAVSAGLSR
jgi:hypothetical protein